MQTSNATFIRTDQIDQQFAITRLRAIETGRWVVVASTNGISGVIAPDGTVVAAAAQRTQDVLVEPVGLVAALTPAVRLGPWPGRLLRRRGAAGPRCGRCCRIVGSRRRSRAAAGRPVSGPERATASP